MKILVMGFYRLSKPISTLSGVMSAIFISMITIIIVYGVIMRYIFHKPMAWVDPLSIYSMIGLTFIGASYAMHTDKHIRVDVVIKLFKERTQRIIQILMYVIALAYTILLGVLSFKMAYLSFLAGRTDEAFVDIPLFVPQLLIPMGCFLLILSIFAKISENICLLKGWKEIYRLSDEMIDQREHVSDDVVIDKRKVMEGV